MRLFGQKKTETERNNMKCNKEKENIEKKEEDKINNY